MDRVRHIRRFGSALLFGISALGLSACMPTFGGLGGNAVPDGALSAAAAVAQFRQVCYDQPEGFTGSEAAAQTLGLTAATDDGNLIEPGGSPDTRIVRIYERDGRDNCLFVFTTADSAADLAAEAQAAFGMGIVGAPGYEPSAAELEAADRIVAIIPGTGGRADRLTLGATDL